MLSSMQLYPGGDYTYAGGGAPARFRFATWTEDFANDAWASVWEAASWVSVKPNLLSGLNAGVANDVQNAAVVRDTLPIDTSEAYSVDAFLVPWEGGFHGKYRLYARMDDSSPDVTQNGIIAELVMDDAEGSYSGTLTVNSGGSTAGSYSFSTGAMSTSSAGWFKVNIDGDRVRCYWRDVLLIDQTITSQSGIRTGFGLECVNADGVCLVDTFRMQYYSSSAADGLSGEAFNRRHEVLAASSAGKVYLRQFAEALAEITSSVSLNDEIYPESTQIGQKLYIADYSDVRAVGGDGSVNSDGTQLSASGISDWTTLGINTDTDVVVINDVTGDAVADTYQISSVSTDYITLNTSAGSTGDCSYRIERAPKVFDPVNETISILSATAGQVPTGNPLLCRWRNRLVMAGADIAPHVWYMSRMGDPADWDYAKSDAQAAVAGTSSDAGVPGRPITALVPYHDDYLIIGCVNELWQMRGDPAMGGSLDAVSSVVGIISPRAWCLGPSGELFFLSRDGLYVMMPGSQEPPQQISRDRLPRELVGLDANHYHVEMAYDVAGEGVCIYTSLKEVSVEDTAKLGSLHWWFDTDDNTFWPMRLCVNHEPFALVADGGASQGDYTVLTGGRDGILRRFNTQADTDDGLTIESRVFCGPLPLGDGMRDAVLMELLPVIADGSGNVAWETYVGDTPEELLTYSRKTGGGTWQTDKKHVAVRPHGRGQVWGLMLRGANNLPWSFESIRALTRMAGKRRI